MSEVVPIPLNRIVTHNNLMQSRLWALAKRSSATESRAFATSDAGTILLLIHRFGPDATYALVPWGPQPQEAPENGIFLEMFSEALRPHLPEDCIFIRYDLPWLSPWQGRDGDRPSPETMELEMNFGTRNHRLRKAPTDMQPVDTLVIDLDSPPEQLLSRMKGKTRYNIGLSLRKGVRVHPASPRRFDEWYDLYRRTLERHHKPVHAARHFRSLFRAARNTSVATVRPGEPVHRHNVRLLLAEKDGKTLAGMVLAVSGNYGMYLYGASAGEERDAMATYLLQWRAMEAAKRLGAHRYDLYGIPPDRRPGHPMHGLLRFKEGFGGEHITRRGCWDYPYDVERYRAFAGREAADRGYHGE